MHRRRVSRRRAVSEATAEVIIMTVILIGFTIFIGVYAPFLKNGATQSQTCQTLHKTSQNTS